MLNNQLRKNSMSYYFDKDTNEVKGKCKLQAKKSYVVFEIKDNKK